VRVELKFLFFICFVSSVRQQSSPYMRGFTLNEHEPQNVFWWQVYS